ncbi:MAG: hypothetical protein KGH72_02375 [Candidatus Micrarchaeota archaeon]|nr:hypothetical protein [Candidatus Micrarchaeota archaeon]
MVDGGSKEDAIKIDVSNELEGSQAEDSYIARLYGRRNKDWRFESQRQIEEDGKSYDIVTIVLNDGTKREIYFDTSEYFAK